MTVQRFTLHANDPNRDIVAANAKAAIDHCQVVSGNLARELFEVEP